MITSQIPTITAADILILDHLSQYRLESATFMPWQTTALGMFEEVRAVPVAVIYRRLDRLTKAGLVEKHVRKMIKDTLPKDRTRYWRAIASYTITQRGRVLLRAYRDVFLGEIPLALPKPEGVLS